MSNDSWYDIWEDWAFETADDKFWLAFSRVILTFAFGLAVVASVIFLMHVFIVTLGPWMAWAALVTLGLAWVRWTLTGGKN